jgi:hypothetical protein
MPDAKSLKNRSCCSPVRKSACAFYENGSMGNALLFTAAPGGFGTPPFSAVPHCLRTLARRRPTGARGPRLSDPLAPPYAAADCAKFFRTSLPPPASGEHEPRVESLGSADAPAARAQTNR